MSNIRKVVKLFLSERSSTSIDPKNELDSKNGLTQPLFWVKQLFKRHKSDIDSKDGLCGRTPLSWAAERGHEAVVKLLLATGKADVDSKDGFGRTPLSWAAENGHEAVLKLLRSVSAL